MKNWKPWLWIALGVYATLSLAGCGSRARVGDLQTESQSIELGDAEAVRVEIELGAGDLEVTGGAEKLLEAAFTYNTARLRPEVRYSGGQLVVRQPDAGSLPVLRNITAFRNEWRLRLYDEVPMDLSVEVGGGAGRLYLAGLSLTGLAVDVGVGDYTLDLSGDWARDLDVTIDSGVADLRVRLPSDVGVRVEIDDGPHTVEASGLTQVEGVYTNAAYGASEVMLHVTIEAGVGRIDLEVAEAE